MTGLNEQEFVELVDKHRAEFERYVARNVWNSSDVEDVLADAILVAWEKRESFQKGTNFRAWMYRILMNKFFVANRHTMRHSVDYDSVFNSKDNGSAVPKHQEKEDIEHYLQDVPDDLYSAMNNIRPVEREALMLRCFQHCSYKEIAEVMAIPVGTVMTHLSRGRARLKKLLPERVRERIQEFETSNAA
jgi:RNA polymerase sigma-70 factor (ECF subfamily)